jgi:hypothetical protein
VRSWLVLLVLALVVGGLGAWLYYKPREGENAGYAISTIKPGDVTRVRLTRRIAQPQQPAAQEEIALEKRDGEWRMTSPTTARADAVQVDRLLSILEARASFRYPAADLARYGLDAPPIVLSANDVTIAYGAINPTTREQYVLAGNHVYPVPLAHAAALPRNIDALISKSLFAQGEKPVRFDLPDFTVALEDGTWAVAPIASEAGPDERNAWVEAWRTASALTVAPHTGSAPAEAVKVTLKDGRTIELGIAQRTPDVVLVRGDEGVAYHFFAEAGRRLLAPPGEKKSDEVKK